LPLPGAAAPEAEGAPPVAETTLVEKPDTVGRPVAEGTGGTVEAPPTVLAPPAADEAPEGAADVPDLAAAWKASKDFSAVGLIAKTIPALQ